ncbi:MAG: hypothetical protein II178_09825 [Selenomonadaceae bacterium]|nr:hypothetical protein [Selenomonadaceae bacterium]
MEKLLPAIETLKQRTDPTGQTEANIYAMENLLKVSMATGGKASGKILHNPRQKNANGWLAMMNFVKDKYPRNPEKWLDEFLVCVDETADNFWSSNANSGPGPAKKPSGQPGRGSSGPGARRTFTPPWKRFPGMGLRTSTRPPRISSPR